MTAAADPSECLHVRPFIERLGYTAIEQFSTISAVDLRDHVMIHFAGLKSSSMGRYVTSLRNFFRFLEYKSVKISDSILTISLDPANWKGSKLPVTLTIEEEERLRSHIFSDTELGVRKRVIQYLLLDLGLRCSGIPGIQLRDIHCNGGTRLIRNTKNGAPRELPLSQNLGQALEIYIMNHRPRHAGNSLLLNTKLCKQHSPVTVGTVRSVVRNVFKRCPVSGWWKDPHSIRRTTASNIHNSGAGVKLTADILGHESLDSTTHYVRVDLTALRDLLRMARKGGGKMNTNRISKQLDEYLDYKHSLGFKLKHEETILRGFAKYTFDTGYTGSLHIEIVLAWIASGSHKDKTMGRKIQVIKPFSRYVSAFDSGAQCIEAKFYRDTHDRPEPYIYSENEVLMLNG